MEKRQRRVCVENEKKAFKCEKRKRKAENGEIVNGLNVRGEGEEGVGGEPSTESHLTTCHIIFFIAQI